MRKLRHKKCLLRVPCVVLWAVFASILPATAVTQEQGKRVAGEVTSQDGKKMPGVTVFIEGTAVGTVTDKDGKYAIVLPVGSTQLTFSFIGYQTTNVDIGSKTEIDIVLQEVAEGIEQVVVVGYGVQKKESSVAAIAQISGTDLAKVGASNLSSALAGQVPGLMAIQSTGQPGNDGAQLMIRGVSSWQGNDPLVMVDGVERAFNDIDPREIETISVLKDASATAVFGVRGANGVILITTKRGKKGEIKVNFSAEYTLKQPTGISKPENSYITGLVMNEAYKNDNDWGKLLSDEVLEHYRIQDMPYIYPNTNWIDMMFKNVGFGQNYNVNVSGGTDFARVFASLSYTNEGDIMKLEKMPDYDPRYQYDRYNYRFNIDANLTKTTTLSLDAGGYIGIKNEPYETGPLRRYRPVLTMGPMDIPPYYPAWLLDEYPDSAHPDETGERIATSLVQNAENPLIANQYSGSRQTKTTNLNVTMRLNQKLDFITSGLSLNIRGAYNNTTPYYKTYEYNAVTYNLDEHGMWTRKVGRDNTIDGEAPQAPVAVSTESLNTSSRTWYLEASLNYSREFGRHSVSGLILGQRRKTQSDVAFPHYEQGMVARFTYDYDKRYLFEGNIGVTGSEQFAPNNRYGIFPSLAIGWNLHNEKFYKPLAKIMNRAKVRLSYGEVGSDNSPDRWLYTSSYVNGTTGTAYKPGTATNTGPSIISIIEQKAANINAGWERAIKQDIGFELAFLNSMFVLNMDFYKENRTHILLSREAVPAWFGVDLKQQNLGETETRGYEIELKFQRMTRRGLSYWVKPAVAFSDNRIIHKDEPVNKPSYQKREGMRINQVMGYHSAGFIQDPDMQMNSIRYGSGIMGLGDVMWVDFTGDGVIDAMDQAPIGYAETYPLYNYSLSAGISYKNISIDVLFQGASHITRYVIDNYTWPLHRTSFQVFDFQRDAWNPGNRNAEFPSLHHDANRTHNTILDGAIRTGNTYDASYLRLKSARISYSFPKKLANAIGLEKLNVYISGNNLWTWCPGFTHADPEPNLTGNALAWHSYPMIRRFQIGLNLSF